MPLQAAAERLEFTPPPEPGQARAFGLAMLAHLLLVAALAWGITWKSDSREVTAEAELWSATVQLAAPALVETPPPPPAPAPPPPPAPPQPTPVVAPPAPPPPQVKDAAIAIEREKELRRKEEEKERKAQEKLKKDKAEKEAREALEKKAADKKAKDRQQAEQKAAEKSAEKKAAEKAAKEQRARDEADAKRTAQLREENLKRMQGLAGATGGPAATGNALKSSGPSDSYAGRIRARIKPNIVFTEDIPGNPVAEVEVKMAADGTITSRRITKSSGVKSWDEAVLRALDRTEVLPKDVDGRVISPLIMEFKPKGP